MNRIVDMVTKRQNIIIIRIGLLVFRIMFLIVTSSLYHMLLAHFRLVTLMRAHLSKIYEIY